jgi:alcohol dehydrogenase YqhD (iron-dependent ADH family)
MLDFTFYNPARIEFGHGALSRLCGNIKRSGGTKVLIHYGSSSIKKNGLLDKIRGELDKGKIPFMELGGVKPNPRLSLIKEGIELCKKSECDLILAAGGGSGIDSAKGIAIGVAMPGEVWDYYMDDKLVIEKALPIGSVLTIPAAGSESSNGSVVTNDNGQMKRSAIGEVLIPKFAILNPEFTFTLPKYQVACGITDIIAHLMERYFTQEKYVDLTDRMIEGAINTMLMYAPVTLNEPQNYDARAEIMWCSTIAHNGLLNTGRLGDWGSHKIEHEISGIYDIAHGAGLAIIFPAWMRYVYKENPGRFLQFAIRVFKIDNSLTDTEAVIFKMIEKLKNFFKSIGMPTCLSEAGIDDSRFKEMAEKAMINRKYVGAFKPLYTPDIEAILRLAL